MDGFLNGHSEGWMSFVSVGGLASLGVSAVFYLLSAHHGGKVTGLELTQPLDSLEGAKELSGCKAILGLCPSRARESQVIYPQQADAPCPTRLCFGRPRQAH